MTGQGRQHVAFPSAATGMQNLPERTVSRSASVSAAFETVGRVHTSPGFWEEGFLEERRRTESAQIRRRRHGNHN